MSDTIFFGVFALLVLLALGATRADVTPGGVLFGLTMLLGPFYLGWALGAMAGLRRRAAAGPAAAAFE